MNYYLFTYIDAVSKIPSTEGVMRNGPSLPEGLEVEFMLESEYPTETPRGYGKSEENLSGQPGILAKVSAKDFKQAKKDEENARLKKDKDFFRHALNCQRGDSLYEPLFFNGHLFDVNLQSLDILASAASRAYLSLLNDDGYQFTWTTADNHKIKLTPREILELHAKFFLRANELHTQFGQAKDRVQMSQTFEEIQEVLETPQVVES